MDMEYDTPDTPDTLAVAGAQEENGTPPRDKTAERAQVQKLLRKIKADEHHHNKAYRRMRRDMRVAMHGCEASYSDANYKANITGRHVKQKTAALYAKNPKAVARRRDTLDFVLWDENPESLMMAMQTIQMAQEAQMAAQAQPPVVDEMGQVMPPDVPLPPGFEQAQALLEDYQQGMARRIEVKKFGKTLELLFANAQREQKPVDFKAGMKQVVRRACTTGVGYVKLSFQRETGLRPGHTEKLTDFRDRIEHLKRLAQEAQEGEIDDTAAEMAELEAAMAALQAEPEVIIREGLVVDYPLSTRVIPDKQTTQLMGFVGARHLSIKYLYSPCEIEEVFGVDIGKSFTPYAKDKKENGEEAEFDNYSQADLFNDRKGEEMVCVYEHFDKASGLVYYIADGHPDYLTPPAAPDVFVSDFWPVYALTFNAVESEDELFPLSDVSLLLDMQREYNRSRQGKREHRKAARPRWGYPTGALDEKDIDAFKKAEPFEAFALSLEPGAKIGDVLQPVPVPGVDPNLYDVNEIFGDMQIVVGAQQAQLGGLSKASATEVATAANASSSGDGSSVDDLDTFLSNIARAAGQILMREMSLEQVQRIAGRGAVWLDQTSIDIYEEVVLEVEAGSSGKPNQAVEINNWKEMLPFLIQMPGIQSMWLAKQTLQRLDDKLDLVEAIAEGLPSVVMQNAQKQVGTGNPATDPNSQGGQGGDNAPKGQEGTSGSSAPMGDNNSTPGIIRYGADGGRL